MSRNVRATLAPVDFCFVEYALIKEWIWLLWSAWYVL
jgi:hypothetical protein